MYKGSDAASITSQVQGRMTSLKNALKISDEVISVVQDFIEDGIYRGESYKDMVDSIVDAKIAYEEADNKELWLAKNYKIPASNLKGSAMWILLGEIEKGTPIQDAERIYLKAVDPTNYMRVTTIASERQTKKALQFLVDNGYKESIFRKHATIAEIEHHKIWEEPSVEYVKDEVDELFNELPTKKSQAVTKGGGEEISMKEALELIKFANTVEVSVTESNKNHIAVPSMPKFEDSKPMYKWDCGFGWTYRGGLSDVSNIAESVKSQGGNIDATHRVSLAWFAADDLDISMNTPKGKVYFGHRKAAGWTLDVDMNAGGTDNGINPIENLFTNSPEDGEYKVMVRQYGKRDKSIRDDFYVEVAMPNFTKTVHYPTRLVQGKIVEIARFTLKDGKVTNFTTPLDLVNEETATKWYNVTQILSTPKESALHHTFFVLGEYKYSPDEKIRGLFIDAMKPELREHRKVLELVGDKTAFEVQDNGAIMFGIADNKENLDILIKIDGKPYKIVNSKT